MIWHSMLTREQGDKRILQEVNFEKIYYEDVEEDNMYDIRCAI